METSDIIGNIFLIAGAFFIFTGAAGILRMPDFFSRLHPAGIGDALGLPLAMIGVMIHAGPGLITIKIAILVVFAMVTSATACHALAKAALISGVKPTGYISKNVDIKENQAFDKDKKAEI